MPSQDQDRERILECAKGLPLKQKVRFQNIPNFVSRWAEDFGGLEGKRVLDFGCGFGLSTAGISLLNSADLAVGVDIGSEAEACESFLSKNFNIQKLPSNLVFERIEPGQTTSYDEFDCIFSWSVFEHVNNRIYSDILSGLYSKLKKGGIFFVQISPLYFSPEGGHLWEIGYRHWEHLLNQTSDVCHDIMSAENIAPSKKNELWSMFQNLNRITSDELIARFEESGFALTRERRDSVNILPPKQLVTAYSRESLTNTQIVALFQKR